MAERNVGIYSSRAEGANAFRKERLYRSQDAGLNARAFFVLWRHRYSGSISIRHRRMGTKHSRRYFSQQDNLRSALGCKQKRSHVRCRSSFRISISLLCNVCANSRTIRNLRSCGISSSSHFPFLPSRHLTIPGSPPAWASARARSCRSSAGRGGRRLVSSVREKSDTVSVPTSPPCSWPPQDSQAPH